MKVIIPVAGKGTRVRPHSYSKPKPFIHVGDKMVIQHILDHVLTLKPEAVIIVHDKINGDACTERLPQLYPKVRFHFVQQDELLGTAHAVVHAKPFIKEGEDILIVFCDSVFKKDLSCIAKLKGHDGIIFAKEVEDYRRFGVIVHKNKIITKIVEKPDEPISKLANIGVYYVKDGLALMNYARRVMDENKRVRGEYYLTDAFALMIEDGKRLYVEDVDDWLDVGTIQTILESNAKLLNGRTWQGKNVIVENSHLGKNVAINDNTVVKNCKIENAIIGKNTVLDGLEIQDSIIGDNVSLWKNGKVYNIGDNCTIE